MPDHDGIVTHLRCESLIEQSQAKLGAYYENDLSIEPYPVVELSINQRQDQSDIDKLLKESHHEDLLILINVILTCSENC